MPDLIVPCPSSRQRTDFTRSWSLGHGAARVLDLTVHDILTRTDENPPRSSQKGKDAPDTFSQVLDAVKVEASGPLPEPANVLLVDDLRTHGVTAASSAHALRENGAKDVRLLSFAKYETRAHLEGYCD